MKQLKLHARADLFAGMSTAIVMMPQAMAYSLLAGLNPIHGLYAATIPVFVYAFLGSSAHISIAPVAILAIMHGMLLSKIPQAVYLEHSLLLTAMVGSLLLLFWLCRLGRLIQLISHSLIEGFITGAALLTALTQLSYMLGLEIASESLAHTVHRRARSRLFAQSTKAPCSLGWRKSWSAVLESVCAVSHRSE